VGVRVGGTGVWVGVYVGGTGVLVTVGGTGVSVGVLVGGTVDVSSPQYRLVDLVVCPLRLESLAPSTSTR
jgi:hypothetical protein